MLEIEKIARAQNYINKLANGLNPLDNSEIPENDIVNNVRISRCLFYVSDILNKIIENNGTYKAKMPERVPFTITYEQLSNYQLSDTPVTISEICKNINSLIDTIYVKELKSTILNEWLLSIDALCNVVVNNKTYKRPTSQGEQLGITTETRMSKYGASYLAVLYNRSAQKFILDNMEAIIQLNKDKN